MMNLTGGTDDSGHQFEITVTDSKGNNKSGTLKVVINQETEK